MKKTVTKDMYGITCHCCEGLMEMPKLHIPIMFGNIKGLQHFLMTTKIDGNVEPEAKFDESRIVKVRVTYQAEVKEKE